MAASGLADTIVEAWFLYGNPELVDDTELFIMMLLLWLSLVLLVSSVMFSTSSVINSFV